jgi:hypothetical protein
MTYEDGYIYINLRLLLFIMFFLGLACGASLYKIVQMLRSPYTITYYVHEEEKEDS